MITLLDSYRPFFCLRLGRSCGLWLSCDSRATWQFHITRWGWLYHKDARGSLEWWRGPFRVLHLP